MDESIYQEFFEHSIDLFCIINPEGYFTVLNNAWTRTLGYSLEELKARPYTDFIHPKDRNSSAEAVDLVNFKNIIPEHFENRYIAKDGSIRVFKWVGNVKNGRIMGIGRDITKQKIASQQIVRDHQIIRAIEDVQKDALSFDEPKLIFESILKILIRLTQCNLAMMALVEYQNQVPYLVTDSITQISRDPKTIIPTNPLPSISLTEFKSVCSYTLETQTLNFCNEMLPEIQSGYKIYYQNFTTVPLCHQNQVVAVIALFNRENQFSPGIFTELSTLIESCNRIIVNLKQSLKNDQEITRLSRHNRLLGQQLDSLGTAVMHLNSSLFVEYVNSSCLRLLGYTLENIQNKHLSHFIHNENDLSLDKLLMSQGTSTPHAAAPTSKTPVRLVFKSGETKTPFETDVLVDTVPLESVHYLLTINPAKT